MDNHKRAAWGADAVKAGTPDFASNDAATNATDAVVNILHWLYRDNPPDPGEVARVLAAAQGHFWAERGD